MSGAVLLVTAAGREVGLRASQVLRVLENPPVMALPPVATPTLWVSGMIASGGAPVPLIDLARWLGEGAAVHDGPVALLQGKGYRIACRVAAIKAFRQAPPAALEIIDAAALAFWQDMPSQKVSRAAPVQKPPPAVPQPGGTMLNLRLAGRPVCLPAAQVSHLFEPQAAVILDVPSLDAPAPAILLHQGRAIAMRDLGCRRDATTPIVLARAGAGEIAFAVEAIPWLGPAGGPVLELPGVADGAVADAASRVAAGDDFLEVVLGGRACLLPFAAVIRVLPQEGRQKLPGLPGGSIRAVSGQVLPGQDVRPALDLPDTADLAHDIVLRAPAGPAFFLPVERVRGLRTLHDVELTRLAGAPGLIEAVSRRLWVLRPQGLLDALHERTVA